MTYDEIKDRLWKVSRELQQVVEGMPKADDRPRRVVANKIGHAFADVMAAIVPLARKRPQPLRVWRAIGKNPTYG